MEIMKKKFNQKIEDIKTEESREKERERVRRIK